MRGHAAAAGARRLEARVRRVARQCPQWHLTTGDGDVLRAALLVDATGRGTGPAQLIGIVRRSGPPLVAIWAVGAVADAPGDRTLVQAQGGGWWYGAFLPDGRPLAAFHTAPALGARLTRGRAAWADRLRAADVLSRRMPPALFDDAGLRGAAAGGAALERSAGDDWVACGDAATAFDPIAAQGIFNALCTGMMAARALLAADRRAALGDYERQAAPGAVSERRRSLRRGVLAGRGRHRRDVGRKFRSIPARVWNMIRRCFAATRPLSARSPSSSPSF